MSLTHRFGIALIAAAAGLTLTIAYLGAKGFEVTLVDLFVIQFLYMAAYVPAVAVAETHFSQKYQLAEVENAA